MLSDPVPSRGPGVQCERSLEDWMDPARCSGHASMPNEALEAVPEEIGREFLATVSQASSTPWVSGLAPSRFISRRFWSLSTNENEHKEGRSRQPAKT